MNNKTTTLRDELNERITDLLNSDTSAIEEMLRASESGRAGFSINVRLTLVKGRAYVKAKMSWADRHAIETEGSAQLFDPDPDQGKMGG